MIHMNFFVVLDQESIDVYIGFFYKAKVKKGSKGKAKKKAEASESEKSKPKTKGKKTKSVETESGPAISAKKVSIKTAVKRVRKDTKAKNQTLEVGS